jgi:pimeloyl-ACP methyl ester carboxylesterase
MSEKKHFVVFSHGFGVRFDNRGMFTDIVDALGDDLEPVLFDYNDYDVEKNELTVHTFSKQSNILRKKVDAIRKEYPDAIIDLVAHSQGCTITALPAISGIRRVILISPPIEVSTLNTIERVKSRPGAHIDLEGVSKLPRTDGSVTVVPAAYWTERVHTNPKPLYKKLARDVEMTVIRAKSDQIVGTAPFDYLDDETAHIVNLPGDHDFSGDDRVELVQTVVHLLLEPTKSK